MSLSDLEASRLLFAFSAAYHFLFVPLTIGLAALIALLEGLALFRKEPHWRDAARFFSAPFVVNFACGLATGYPLRSQIALHWAGYAEAVAPVFGTVFALESRVAPLMVGLVLVFAFGWRLKPLWHWLVSCALAVVLIVQSSAILMLNAWMQLPGELLPGNGTPVSMAGLAANPLVASKIVHTVGAAWVLGGMFAVAVGAWFLLQGRHLAMARGCVRAGSLFALASLLVTAQAGHRSGELLVTHQPVKFAAIEALWAYEGDSPGLVLFALPDMAAQANRLEVTLPGVLGWIAGQGEQPLPTLRTGLADTKARIRDDLRDGRRQQGHAALLGPVSPGTPVSEAQIEAAALRALPDVPRVFWAFRTMLGCAVVMAVLCAALAWRLPDPATARGRRWLRAGVLALPLPWVAIQAGWLVCEAGRQPWTVTGWLLTEHSAGAVPAADAALQLLFGLAAGLLLFTLNLRWHLHHLRRGPVAPSPSWGRLLASLWLRRQPRREAL